MQEVFFIYLLFKTKTMKIILILLVIALLVTIWSWLTKGDSWHDWGEEYIDEKLAKEKERLKEQFNQQDK